MENAVIVNQNPNRKNIAYSVQAVSGGANNTFTPFIEDLRKNGTSSERVIIYCQTIKVISHVYGVFKGDLGGDMYVTQGDPKSSMSSSLSKPALQEREVTCNQRKKLHAKLEYLKTSFSKDILDIASVKNAALFTSPELLSGFGATQIHQNLFSVADVHKYMDIWDPSVATELMVAIEQILTVTIKLDQTALEATVPLNPCLLGASSNDSMPKKWNAAATMSASRTRLMNLLHCAGLQCESVTTSLQFTRFRNAKREVLSEADPPFLSIARNKTLQVPQDINHIFAFVFILEKDSKKYHLTCLAVFPILRVNPVMYCTRLMALSRCFNTTAAAFVRAAESSFLPVPDNNTLSLLYLQISSIRRFDCNKLLLEDRIGHRLFGNVYTADYQAPGTTTTEMVVVMKMLNAPDLE
ncbi:hypothetical protein P5673_024394 [Acropora cervicornis]|uniref:Uncharacterized protein n=1 Tax=Acropora cervicornis TaxID=6130 RepID=A0AAD9Q3G2_ACRCE|nr:hypothetical protein P5673_024394 [Acropora cervicornis]